MLDHKERWDMESYTRIQYGNSDASKLSSLLRRLLDEYSYLEACARKSILSYGGNYHETSIQFSAKAVGLEGIGGQTKDPKKLNF